MAIPNSAQTAEVQSNMSGTRGKFSVHEHAHEKIMGVLTNLYEDPEGAVVREYLTNALDAQIEAQEADPSYVWRPIEVTTPSHFNTTYKIRDFGTGMTLEDIEKVYSQYGYSTKEHTNSQTGMLGLGSKCGLTYTGQFTITGYKNGLRTRALITLNEDEVPEYVVMDTSATTEPNGVEISVPVRDRNTFAEKTRDFLRWWKPGQVLVNGIEPDSHGMKEVKPGVYLLENDGSRYYRSSPQSYVIMGNVPYTVDNEYVAEDLREVGYGFAAYVPMGTVDFPPNRERLRYNSRTKAAVEEISKGLFELVLADKIKSITDAPTYKDAWVAHANLDYVFSRHSRVQSLTYKGYPFIERIKHDNLDLTWDWQDHGQVSTRSYVSVANMMNYNGLIVVDVDQQKKPTSYFKKKVLHYMRENDLTGGALLVDDDVDSVWSEHLPRIDAETIKSIKLPKNGPAGPRTETPYDFYTHDGSAVVQDQQVVVDCPKGKTLAYISPQAMRETYRKSGTTAAAVATALGSDYILVVLGKNRFEKFLRTHPKAKSAAEAFQEKVNSLVANANNIEFVISELGYGEKEFVQKADPSLIEDKDLADLITAVQSKNYSSNYKKAEQLYILSQKAEMSLDLPAPPSAGTNPCTRYPLIDSNGGRQLDHMIIYINSVYKTLYAQP